MKRKEVKRKLSQYLRCVISYTDVTTTRVLHYAVSTDDDVVDEFIQMIKDTFVHPDISFTDMIYSYDNRKYFQLI
jgi:hypothetical protein